MTKVMVLSAPTPGLLELRINALLSIIHSKRGDGRSCGALEKIQYDATSNNYTALVQYVDWVNGAIEKEYREIEVKIYEDLE